MKVLPFELEETIAGNLTNFTDFRRFKAAFGASNKLLYSTRTTSSDQFDREIWAFFSSKRNCEMEELTITKMLKAKNHAIGNFRKFGAQRIFI